MFQRIRIAIAIIVSFVGVILWSAARLNGVVAHAQENQSNSAIQAGAQNGLQGFGIIETETRDEVSPEQRARINQKIAEYLAQEKARAKTEGQNAPPSAQAALQLYPFFPQAGIEYRDLNLNNFVDLDPSSNILDYNCTQITYDGHQGHDSDLISFAYQSIGVPNYAVLDGTVVDVHDGEFDMNTSCTGNANYVVLGHGNGQTTLYYHFKKNSILVKQGQQVVAGQQLGLAGSSGCSTAPHLHFESQLNGAVFEPSAGPCRAGKSNWVQQIPIRYETYARNFVMNSSGFGNGIAGFPFDQVPDRTGTFVVGSQPVAFRIIGGGEFPTGYPYRIRYVRPDGTNAFDESGQWGNGFVSPHSFWLWHSRTVNLDVTGQWHLVYDLGGRTIVNAPFDVVASASQIVNRPPNPVSVAFNFTNPTSDDVLFCQVQNDPVTADPDYDIVSYRYQRKVNGNTVRDVTTAALSDALAKGTARAGDTITCTVTPSDGKAMGASATATTTVTNARANPIDDATFYVRQQYYDFLNRQPDSAGLNFWVSQITSCGGDSSCIDIKRQNVSAAYFLSTEFQETGFFVIKVQRVAFGKVSNDAAKRISYFQFLKDAQTVGKGVVVGQAGADQILNQNKTAYAQSIVNSSDFASKYPTSLSASAYVDALYQTANVTPQGIERQDAITAFGSGDTAGRAASLRKIAESNSVKQAEFNAAFVLLQYFGYLRRNPTDAPDTSDAGYQFWLQKLNSFGGDYIQSQMVRSFIVSQEYRQRFGSQ